MRIDAAQLRRVIRTQLRHLLREAGEEGTTTSSAAPGETREMTPNEVQEIMQDEFTAAVSAAHNVAKKNIDDPEKFGIAAYAYVELINAINTGKKSNDPGLSGLAGAFIHYSFDKATKVDTLKDFQEAATDGRKWAIKIDTSDAAFAKVAGDAAAAEAKEGEKKKKELLTKVRASGKSFELSDKDAVIRMQKWLMTQPAAKGKKITADGLYGSETHTLLVKALPDNLPNAANFKKLKFDELLKDEALREDLAQFIIFKEMPWNKSTPAPEKKKTEKTGTTKTTTKTTGKAPTPAQQAIIDQGVRPIGGTGGKGTAKIGSNLF